MMGERESTERCTTGRLSGQFINESTTEVVTTLDGGAGFVYSSIRLFVCVLKGYVACQIVF